MAILTFKPTSVASRDKVSSEYLNEMADNIRNDIRELYRIGTMQISRVNFLLDIISAMDFAVSKAISEITQPAVEAGHILLSTNSYNNIIYPESAKDIHRAVVDKTYNVITLYRISEENQIVLNGEIRKDVVIERETNNNLFLEQPEQIVESDYRAIFESDEPYIIKFKKRTTIPKANVNFNILSSSRNMTINTIRIHPIPSFFNTITERIVPRKSGTTGETLYTATGETISLASLERNKRSLPLYLSLSKMECSSIYFSFDTYNYMPSESASIIGIGSISIDNINYSSKSYIGFQFDVPVGYTTLKSITLMSNEIFMDLNADISWKLYSTIDDFNDMNDNYVLSSNTTIDSSTGYKGLEEGQRLYILMELKETEKDATPLLRYIDLYFEEEI